MQTFFRFVFVLALVVPSYIQAQESADTVEVVATGYGKDVEGAIRNACRAAVEQVVGSMVYAETLVSSGELISDKILSFSGGYVESHKPLEQPKLMDDGLWSIRVSAKIKRRVLGEELQKTGINRVSFDGSSLRMKYDMLVDNQETALDLMEMMAKDLYTNAVSTSLISNDYDVVDNQAILEIETKIDAEIFAAFAKNFLDKLQAVQGKSVLLNQPVSVERKASEQREGQPPVVSISSPSIANKGYRLLVFNSWPRMRVGQISQMNMDVHTIPRDVFNQIPHFFNKKHLVIEALDSNDKVLGVVNEPALVLICEATSDSNAAIFPALHYVTANSGYSLRPSPGLSEYRRTIRMNLSRQELGEVRTMRFRYE